MSQDFNWDKVINGEGDENSSHSPQELEEILNAIDDEPEATELEVVEGGEGEDTPGAQDPYRMAPLPRNLVEPDKTNPGYDMDYRPEYVREQEMLDMAAKARAKPKKAPAEKGEPAQEGVKEVETSTD